MYIKIRYIKVHFIYYVYTIFELIEVIFTPNFLSFYCLIAWLLDGQLPPVTNPNTEKLAIKGLQSVQFLYGRWNVF